MADLGFYQTAAVILRADVAKSRKVSDLGDVCDHGEFVSGAAEIKQVVGSDEGGGMLRRR